jgi:prolyl-tRNA synthetase
MRGREFLMKDAYSFDLDKEGAARLQPHVRGLSAHLHALGLKAIPMRADTGPIGGDLSHEFIVLASTGESEVFCHKDYLASRRRPPTPISTASGLQPHRRQVDEPLRRHRGDARRGGLDAIPADEQLSARGIEVGHIFYFGTKYSEPMGAPVPGRTARTPVHGGSYGIGSEPARRALIEAGHDDGGIIWPDEIAPFDIGVLNLKVGRCASATRLRQLYKPLLAKG